MSYWQRAKAWFRSEPELATIPDDPGLSELMAELREAKGQDQEGLGISVSHKNNRVYIHARSSILTVVKALTPAEAVTLARAITDAAHETQRRQYLEDSEVEENNLGGY